MVRIPAPPIFWQFGAGGWGWIFWPFGAGGWGNVRLPFAVGEVHGEGWFLPVLAASVLSVKLIFAH